ncbi:MAG TPA: hypothetical protein VM818_23020 [Vicinamibacterales bacterium]|jgi:hypothetical protein|nr:hypothetical protein [Vicinamibacterales bacterium]
MRFTRTAAGVAEIATAVAAVLMMAGCRPGPLSAPGTGATASKPVSLSSEAATGSLETTRKQLEGVWDLVALESLPPAGGTTRVPVKASGSLTYDQFGNLTIIAQSDDAAAPVAAREVKAMTFKGRAVIDTVSSELKLMNVTGNVDPNEVLAPERRRRYAFEGDTLKLSSFDDKGQVTAISTWRRRPQ